MEAAGQAVGGKATLERLVREGLIAESDYKRILDRAETAGHCLDAAIELGAVSEEVLLRHLANTYQTKFVSTGKLSQARADRRALNLIPYKVAKKIGVCPILFDPRKNQISVVAQDFDALDVIKTVQMASKAREVKAYVARPAAVRALISKSYRGDTMGFSILLSNEPQAPADSGLLGSSMGAAYSQPDLSLANAPAAIEVPNIAFSAPQAGAAYGQGPDPGIDMAPSMSTSQVSAPGFANPGFDPHAAARQAQGGQPYPQGYPQTQHAYGSVASPLPGHAMHAPPQYPGGQYPGGQYPGGQPGSSAGQMPPAPAGHGSTAGQMPQQPSYGSVSAQLPFFQDQGSVSQNMPGQSFEPTGWTPTAEQFLEAIHVAVALLENDRGDLRGHSAQVASLVARFCGRIGLAKPQMLAFKLAGYLHDLGKISIHHLTALNVAEFEGHQLKAERSYMMPLRLFKSAQLPEDTVASLTHLYERFDGEGFPSRLSGKDVPLGARILAIVETYADLTGHAKNAARKQLSSREACEYLERGRDKVFDPNLLDLFRSIVLGDDLKAKLLSDRPTVLIVDPDPEETTVLDLRLVEQGYQVIVSRDSSDALAKLTARAADVLVTEVKLAPFDGFELVRRAKEKGVGAIPIIFVSSTNDRETINEGFELGATDYVTKPASPDIIAAKVHQSLSAVEKVPRRSSIAPGGVSGTLKEMPLPDLIQIVATGRKTAALKIKSGETKGEVLFQEGAIWDASFGDVVGEDAFYQMVALDDGKFSLDFAKGPSKQTIQGSWEMLLMEGLRRLDESRK